MSCPRASQDTYDRHLFILIHSFMRILFACALLDRATTTNRPIDPAFCVPHYDGRIQLTILPTVTFVLIANHGSCRYYVLSLLYDSMGIETRSTDCEADALTSTSPRM